MKQTTMHAKDVLLAKLASCYITVNGERRLVLQAKNLTATVEKEKVEVSILGRMMKGHKTVSMTGSGSLTIYQNTSLFTNMVKKAKDTGQDQYFDMMVVNEDPTSDAGAQIVTLKDCNIDGCDIAAFDADGELLEQDIDFTFEDFEIIKSFRELEGVEQ
jgi:hypothetical protein